MSVADYGTRKTELFAAINAGKGKVQALLWEQSTGAATADDVRTAKQHVMTLQEQLEDLESLCVVARDRAVQAKDDAKLAAFSDFMADVRALLDERRRLVGEAAEHARAAMMCVARYREINATLRERAPNLNFVTGPAAANVSTGFLMSLHDVAGLAVSHQLEAAQFRPASNNAPNRPSDDDFEQMIADTTYRSLVGFAPSGWMPS